MSRCEYNPTFKRPATEPACEGDCLNEATISLGYDGAYHVCERCADLPEMRRYRKRTPLQPQQAQRLRPPTREMRQGGG